MTRSRADDAETGALGPSASEAPHTATMLIALQQLAGNAVTTALVTQPVVQREPIANDALPDEMQEVSADGTATRVKNGRDYLYFFGCGTQRRGVVTPDTVLSMLEDEKWRVIAGTGLDNLALKKGGAESIQGLIVAARAAMRNKTGAMCTSGRERSAFAVFAVLSETVGFANAAAAICEEAGPGKLRTQELFGRNAAWLAAIQRQHG